MADEHSKKVVFFSHSSKDADLLGRIKNLFCERTGNVFDVFLSSDGQSIRFGTNWAYRVEQAMRACQLMFVFVSPHGMNSRWLYFESGCAYALDAKVIPVALPGVDFASISAPLSHLQGFNLHSSDGLANLIATANQELGSTFDTNFSDDDYLRTVAAAMHGTPGGLFGEMVPFIQEVEINAANLPGLKLKTVGQAEPPTIDRVKGELEKLGVPFAVGEGINCVGMNIQVIAFQNSTNRGLSITLDPPAIDRVFPLSEKLLGALNDGGGGGRTRLDVNFVNAVRAIKTPHVLASRLVDLGVTLTDSGGIAIAGVTIGVANTSKCAWLSFSTENGALVPICTVATLVKEFWNRKLVYIADLQ